MPDLTPTLNHLLTEKHAAKTIPSPESRLPSTETADEFLKEAYRIVSLHIILGKEGREKLILNRTPTSIP